MSVNVHNLIKKGFVDAKTDTSLDLFEEISKLKKQKNAVILAHYYQEPDIQDIADYVGDSLGLSEQAAATNADIIVFAGVHFMAETAKILSPGKKVLLPDLNAGCSLADDCPADQFETFIKKHPGHVVISYVNCSAAVKALTDIVCTSSNALHIVKSIPPEQGIIFAPDRNLGRYIMKQTGRKMVLWDGSCMVHELFSLEKIQALKAEHPGARFIAHPECEEALLNSADYVGSTSGLLAYTKKTPANAFIVATEAGILHQMRLASPDKTFIAAPPGNTCACNDCPHMKLNTLEKVYNCMNYELPEITLPAELIEKAARPIHRMLELSEKLGL
ncbi:MAG: quinolinate synthase NadA [Bacteroidia bacterium]|nr:quinolinate synthase NadA [Bacteroidia bacterium]